MIRRFIAAALALAIAAPVVSAQNQLVNAGLETGTFAGWTLGGNSPSYGVDVDGVLIAGANPPFPPNYTNVRSGNYSAWALVRCSGPCATEYLTMSQTVAVQAATNYSVGYWLGNDSQSGFGMNENDSKAQIFVNGVGLPKRLSGDRHRLHVARLRQHRRHLQYGCSNLGDGRVPVERKRDVVRRHFGGRLLSRWPSW